jgi:hypothetical protein
MPIAHGQVTQPPLPVAPTVVPVGQRVLPVQPARRVTPNKEAGRADLDAEKRRRRAGGDHEGDRGGTLDLEV